MTPGITSKQTNHKRTTELTQIQVPTTGCEHGNELDKKREFSATQHLVFKGRWST
jgi:hypothetical protein